MTRPKAKRAPRQGTFAHWVYTETLRAPHETPAMLARRARAGRYEKATAQAVYNVRWYYDLANAARGAADDGGTDDLTTVIARYGTDAARRAIAQIEAHGRGLAEVTR